MVYLHIFPLFLFLAKMLSFLKYATGFISIKYVFFHFLITIFFYLKINCSDFPICISSKEFSKFHNFLPSKNILSCTQNNKMLILKLYGLFLLKCLDTMWLSRNETTKRRMRWALGVTTIVQNSSQMGLNYQLPPNKKGQIPSKLTCWPTPASSPPGTHW